MRNQSILYCCVLWFITFTSTAQSINNDTLFLVAANAHAESIYNTATRSQAQIYNGSDYPFYLALGEEHPYFMSDDWIDGTIMYDGNLYTNIPTQYDLQKDEVIVEYINGTRLKLSKLNIQYFIINNHKFVLLHEENPGKGFYELLYDGQVKAYGRYKKNFQEFLSSGEILREFKEKTRYFIYKDGVYFPVKNKRSVLDAFSDKKKELNKFISKNKLRYSNDKPSFIIQLSKQYDDIP